jgi:PAS domain-containing protein
MDFAAWIPLMAWVAINVRDISERKRVEWYYERVSRPTERCLMVPDAILRDLDGKILQANQKSAELLGFSQKELKLYLSLTDHTGRARRKTNMEWLRKKRLIPTPRY